ncbi:hypothetical protein HDU77_008337 [Chytriomyces hyalinus]|nr:hypothetical protein HDU77_008337 [Chytriomyces hyalinus]
MQLHPWAAQEKDKDKELAREHETGTGIDRSQDLTDAQQQQQQQQGHSHSHAQGHTQQRASPWTARPSTPLAPPSSSTTDWSTSSQDWSSRSANAQVRALKPVTSVPDPWRSTAESVHATAGWGPPPSASSIHAGTGWPVSVPSAQSTNDTASLRRASFSGWNNSNPNTIGRRVSDMSLTDSYSRPPSASPSQPAASAGSAWNSVPGIPTIAEEPSFAGTDSAASSAQKKPSISISINQSSGGWGAPPNTPATPSSSSALQSGWVSAQGISPGPNSAQKSAPISSGWNSGPTQQKSEPSSNNGWDTNPGPNTQIQSNGWGSPSVAPPRPTNNGWGVAPRSASVQSSSSSGWDSSFSAPANAIQKQPSPNDWNSNSTKEPAQSSTPSTTPEYGWNTSVRGENQHSPAKFPSSVRQSDQNHSSGWGAPPKESQGWSSTHSTPVRRTSQPFSGSSTSWSTQQAAERKNVQDTTTSSGWDDKKVQSPATSSSGWDTDSKRGTSFMPSAGASGWGNVPGTSSAKLNSAVNPPDAALGGGAGWNAVPGVETKRSETRWNSGQESVQQQTAATNGWGSAVENGRNSPSKISNGGKPTGDAWNSPSVTPPRRDSFNSGASMPSPVTQVQSDGWGAAPSSVAGTGWGGSPASATSGVTSARPTHAAKSAGGWNPQGWNSSSAVGSAHTTPGGKLGLNNISPRGPPVNASGWGGMGLSSSVSTTDETGSAEGGRVLRGESGLDGKSNTPIVRRAKSSIDVVGRGTNTSGRGFFNDSTVAPGGDSRPQQFVKPVEEVPGDGRLPADGSGPKSTGIFIYGLPPSFRMKEIISVFGEFGEVVNVGLVPASSTNARAYAHVEYEDAHSATKALAMSGKTLTASSDPLDIRSAVSVIPSENASGAQSAPGFAPAAKDGVPQSQVNPDNRTLHIANAPLNVDKFDIEKAFGGRQAEIRLINIVPRPKEKRSMVFITFKTPASASKALATAKSTKHFGMTEVLKIEFSRAETRSGSGVSTAVGSGNTTTTSPSTNTAITKKRSDASGLSAHSLNSNGKLTERKSIASLNSVANIAPSAASGSLGKKNLRPSLYIRDIRDSETVESLTAVLEKIGPVRSCYILPRLDGGVRYGLITFVTGEDAARAVRDKVENAVYPRQRRITIKGFEIGTTEGQLVKIFSAFGEIKRADLLSSTSAELEFARGDGAILAHISLVEQKVLGLPGVTGGYSLPTSKDLGQNNDDWNADEHRHGASSGRGTPASFANIAKNEGDVVCSAQDSADFFNDDEVIRLADLEE